jgi:methionyl-tRNA synthetase
MKEKCIDIEMFKKVEIRTGVVLEAEKLKGADKLLKLVVDLGSEKRQIVAGVAESYPPDTVVGKTVIVAANLKPAKIRGVESQGMILAAETGKGYTLLTTDEEAAPGALVE